MEITLPYLSRYAVDKANMFHSFSERILNVCEHIKTEASNGHYKTKYKIDPGFTEEEYEYLKRCGYQICYRLAEKCYEIEW